MRAFASGLLRSVRGFGRAASLPGCARLVAVGLGIGLTLFPVGPAQRWAAVPVDVESAALPERADPALLELQALLGGRAGLEPARRTRVARAIVEEARAAGLEPLLVMALIDVESEGDPAAVSARGARGLMQLRPHTLRAIAEEEGLGLARGRALQDDPALNVRLGIRYLHRLTRAFGSLGLALVAYNAGPHRVRGYLRAGEPIPASLRAYPRRVRREYQRLASLGFAGGLGPGLGPRDLSLGFEVAFR